MDFIIPENRDKRGKLIKGILLLILLVLFMTYARQAHASFYSIQTCAYTPASIAFAKSHFESLSDILDEKERDHLRIERGSKFLFVKVGKFDSYSEANILLEKIKETVSDAFILKEEGLKKNNIVQMYKQPSASKNAKEEKQISGKHSPAAESSDARDSKKPEYTVIITGKNEPEEQKQRTELLLNDVSKQYYKGDYGKAADLLRLGIEQWPDNPDLYAWYGAALLNMKNPENALQQYRRAAEMSPDVSDYHSGAGVSLIYIYMDKAKESINAFKKALELDPKNVSALEGLGFVYVSIGKKDLANEIYNRLAAIDKEAAKRLYLSITRGINWEQDKSE